MRNVKAVIFDLGNVLVRLDFSGEKFQRMTQAVGIAPHEALARFSHLTEMRRFMAGDIDAREFYQASVDRFKINFSYDEFAAGWCDMFAPIAEMKELFDTVAARYAVGILSDTDPLHWNRLCTIMPWLADVRCPTLSFEVGCLKPHPKMYETAAANCGAPMEECLFIDDRQENVDGARYFGMPALLFCGVEKLRKDLAGLNVLKPSEVR